LRSFTPAHLPFCRVAQLHTGARVIRVPFSAWGQGSFAQCIHGLAERGIARVAGYTELPWFLDVGQQPFVLPLAAE